MCPAEGDDADLDRRTIGVIDIHSPVCDVQDIQNCPIAASTLYSADGRPHPNYAGRRCRDVECPATWRTLLCPKREVKGVPSSNAQVEHDFSYRIESVDGYLFTEDQNCT